MIKLFSAITVLTLIQTQVRGAYYNCTSTNFPQGIILPSRNIDIITFSCGEGCACTGLSNNTCQFGPNEDGEYVTQQSLSSELADSCKLNPNCACNEDINDPTW